MKTYPKIIQGGMGVYVSGSPLTQAVSLNGQQGTLSGTMLERVLAFKLQMGDIGGDIRRALSDFPFPNIKDMVLEKFFLEGGIKDKNKAMNNVPMFSINPPKILIALTICANYAFVKLAKEGHSNPVSINYLEKVAMPHPYTITGAMLALNKNDFITMGAGMPFDIPQLINSVYEWGIASYPIQVIGRTDKFVMRFNLNKFLGERPSNLEKPGFIPIISSDSLAKILKSRVPEGSISALAIERTNEKGEPNAGGHNAGPRNKIEYGERDIINYSRIVDLGIPFYIGGATASPEMLEWALSVGAQGIQAGSIFALSEESGMDPLIKAEVRKLGFNGQLDVKTDMVISPTGFPFKVVILNGTISVVFIYESRTRICNKGGLVSLYEKEDGTIGYRCSAEPFDKFIAKGGKLEEAIGKGCLCNGLFSTVGMNSDIEPPIVTIGDDVSFLRKLMANENSSYTAKDAIEYLIGS